MTAPETRRARSGATTDVLFLAADLCASTAFKDRNARLDGEGRPQWLTAFRAFFDGFPLVLTTRIGLAYMDQDDIDMPEVRVWRTVGDEIVLRADCRSPQEAGLLCRGFNDALASFDRTLAQRHGLRLKGAAWLVPIPYPNIEILVPEIGDESRGAAAREVLGPDMDIGFRVKARAVEGQMAVSLNLACRMALAPDFDPGVLRLRERVALKGVGGGFAYPMILFAPTACGADGLDPPPGAGCEGEEDDPEALPDGLEGTLRMTAPMLRGLAAGYDRATRRVVQQDEAPPAAAAEAAAAAAVVVPAGAGAGG